MDKVLVDLSKLYDLVKNTVKKTEYDELVKKMSDIIDYTTDLVKKKASYNTEISEIKTKIIIIINTFTKECIKLTTDNFAARLKQANLASKNHIAVFVKNAYFKDKLKTLNKKVT